MAAFKFQDQAFLANTRRHGVTPASFPGLLRWYRADDYLPIGVDGDTVGGGTAVLGEWIDRTGSGDDANHPTSGGIFKTNIVGTMPVIRQTNQFLNFAPGNLTDFTIFAAHRRTAFPSFILENTANNHQFRRGFGGVPEALIAGSVDGVFGDPLVDETNFMALAARQSGTTVNFRQDKVDRGAPGTGPGAAGFLVTEIGSNINGSNMDLGELMIWNTVLSDADLDQLYDEYLKPRWVTLP